MSDMQQGIGLCESALSRRALLGRMAGAAVIGAAWPLGQLASAAERRTKGPHQAVGLPWCYNGYLEASRRWTSTSSPPPARRWG